MGLQAGAVEASDGTAEPGQTVYAATVIWYNRVKGYGFAALVGYPRDVMIHNSEIRNGEVPRDYLLKGDELRCRVRLHRGRPSCTDLVLVKPAPELPPAR